MLLVHLSYFFGMDNHNPAINEKFIAKIMLQPVLIKCYSGNTVEGHYLNVGQK